MPHILSIVIHVIEEFGNFIFEAPKLDEVRKDEALRIAARNMLWVRL